jgi:hypothetical protein
MLSFSSITHLGALALEARSPLLFIINIPLACNHYSFRWALLDARREMSATRKRAPHPTKERDRLPPPHPATKG